MSNGNIAQKSPNEILPGRLGNLTAEQESALGQFRQDLLSKQLIHPPDSPSYAEFRMDDHALLRFLRARKFDVAKAVEMFTACEKWRAEKGVDEIFKTFDFAEQAQVNTIYPRFYHKTDKIGRPIYIEILGKLELDQLFKLTTKERMEMFFIYEYERLLRVRLPACSKAVGRQIETSCTILDLKNCSIMQALRIKDQLQTVAQIGQNYYPETMGLTFVVNAPWLFDTVWSILKGWLDEVTVKKIFIFKDGKDHLSTVFEYVDKENLPLRLGGTCQCQGGCECSDLGPWNKK